MRGVNLLSAPSLFSQRPCLPCPSACCILTHPSKYVCPQTNSAASCSTFFPCFAGFPLTSTSALLVPLLLPRRKRRGQEEAEHCAHERQCLGDSAERFPAGVAGSAHVTEVSKAKPDEAEHSWLGPVQVKWGAMPGHQLCECFLTFCALCTSLASP